MLATFTGTRGTERRGHLPDVTQGRRRGPWKQGCALPGRNSGPSCRTRALPGVPALWETWPPHRPSDSPRCTRPPRRGSTAGIWALLLWGPRSESARRPRSRGRFQKCPSGPFPGFWWRPQSSASLPRGASPALCLCPRGLLTVCPRPGLPLLTCATLTSSRSTTSAETVGGAPHRYRVDQSFGGHHALGCGDPGQGSLTGCVALGKLLNLSVSPVRERPAPTLQGCRGVKGDAACAALGPSPSRPWADTAAPNW